MSTQATKIPDTPSVGDTYHCEQCGMEMKVTAPCGSAMGPPVLQCCGATLQRNSHQHPSPEENESSPKRAK
ncbi:MAG: hypothetical protein K8T91_02365 [Planctomycetes bacterium]|nr:hypothetical protein [Planctomycetota bacterium]